MKEIYPWLWIAAIAVVFWLLIVRPAGRRQRETLALQATLAVGDDVMLTSGVLGTIVGTDDDLLELEIAPGTVIRVVRGAVASVRADDASGATGATDPSPYADVEKTSDAATDSEER